jgi:hypothetical protein
MDDDSFPEMVCPPPVYPATPDCTAEVEEMIEVLEATAADEAALQAEQDLALAAVRGNA